MKKLILLTMLLGLIGCGETDQNNSSQATLQSSPTSVNYRMAANASPMSAPVTSFGQWVVNGYSSEGASTVVNASRTISGVATESKALITPNVSQVSKILRKGLGGFALTFAVDELLDGIDWVMDPANNQVRYKEKKLYEGYSFYNPNNVNDADDEGFATPDLAAKNYYTYWCNQGNSNYCGNYTFTCPTEISSSIRCTLDQDNSRGITLFPKKNSTEFEEKTLPLDVVSQEIINNAESGNADAQAVTLAAAQAILSEAENDATKAKEFEDEFERNSDEKCKDHNFKMNSQAAIVQWRYNELIADRFNLFINNKSVSNPLILNGVNKGSWDGHVDQYKYVRGVLRNLINKASNAGCPATPRAEKWVKIEPPSQPGSSS